MIATLQEVDDLLRHPVHQTVLLRAEATTPEEQSLITDLFERVVLYDLKVAEPTAVRRADGRWDVTVPVQAKKYSVDERGAETDEAFAEAIEVGLFTAQPGPDAFDETNVILLERRPIRSGAQALTFVTDRRPTHAGIDPYNYFIDRSSGDNVGEIGAIKARRSSRPASARAIARP